MNKKATNPIYTKLFPKTLEKQQQAMKLANIVHDFAKKKYIIEENRKELASFEF